jgi:hypothetical protein
MYLPPYFAMVDGAIRMYSPVPLAVVTSMREDMADMLGSLLLD